MNREVTQGHWLWRTGECNVGRMKVKWQKVSEKAGFYNGGRSVNCSSLIVKEERQFYNNEAK